MEFARTGEGREIYLERFLRDFAPEELGFTLDTYWVQAGGGDPVQWLNRLAGPRPLRSSQGYGLRGRPAPHGSGL